jgi:hypothetical protein
MSKHDSRKRVVRAFLQRKADKAGAFSTTCSVLYSYDIPIARLDENGRAVATSQTNVKYSKTTNDHQTFARLAIDYPEYFGGAKTMNAETREALEGSIKKWRNIVAGTGVDEGTDNCPLCELFYDPVSYAEQECLGCPVFEKTGHQYCYKTPYENFDLASTHCINDISNKDRREELTKQAQAELDFLISLRPEVSDK